jgi:hypothetical protein
MKFNNPNKIIFIIVIIIIFIYLINIIYSIKEGWVPWVWNIPTRDIYPSLYDYRPLYYPNYYPYYYDYPVISPNQYLDYYALQKYYGNAPYYYPNHPFFRESSIIP